MTHAVYSRNQLEKMNRTQLWVICGQLGVKKFPKNQNCVEGILEKMPQPVEVVEEIELDDYLFHEQSEAVAVIEHEGDSFNSLTQPYVVKVNNRVVFRAYTYSQCERHCNWQGYQIRSEFEQYIEDLVCDERGSGRDKVPQLVAA